ncbi:efflux RND transporter periplasmic adaptor subunit [Granulicella sp. WH15]|uniref:efflux RND transporter periplasmic adaptor subunit n=1 Tax=Granulicella sp. WH15 TaxID=2602070 RepID=UPI0021080EF9|nr:efflux RND transporter periplasmic adaptor subunit [Granulicella sp. WH15]
MTSHTLHARRSTHELLSLFGGLMLAGSLAGCKTDKPAAAATATLAVPVITVARASLSNELTLSAEFTPYQDVDVMAKVAGYVKTISVDIGDHVKQGQVLAVLEVPELQNEVSKARAAVLAAEANITTARSGVERAKAGANMAHLSFTRIEQVVKHDPGLVPRQDVDVAQAHDLEGAAALASAQSMLQSAEQSRSQALAERDRAETMLQYATIRAPFAGVVTKRYANTGSMIQAGIASSSQSMPVVRLAQDNLLRLTLPVPVSAVADVHVGGPVDVNVVTTGRTFPGRVTRFADSLQMSTRTMDTEVDVPNKDGKLVPGMYAEVHLHLADRPNVLSVPLDAVDGLGGPTQSVFVVRNNHIAITNVTVGIQTPYRVEILSGIHEGDVLVVGRHTGLSDGQQVDPRPAAYDTPHK